MKTNLMACTALGALALGAQAQTANAGAPLVLVSTISGGYDLNYYDTPELLFRNTTNFDFTNAQMVLKGYQADNNGVTQTVALGTIGANTTDDVIWGIGASNGYSVPTGGPTAGQLFTYDYDDEYGQQTTNPLCVQPYAICSFVGNFQVTFTATWNNPAYGSMGTEISSVFSPAVNATGGFVGWEGLNPSGLSETIYDDHTGSITGVLANIYLGPPTGGIPEPATWATMILGFGGIGAALRSRRRQVALAD